MKINYVVPVLMAIILTACASTTNRKTPDVDDSDMVYHTGSMLPHKVTSSDSSSQATTGPQPTDELRQILNQQPARGLATGNGK